MNTNATEVNPLRAGIVMILILMSYVLPAAAQAQPEAWAQLAALRSTYFPYYFGESVAISGDTVVVGAPNGLNAAVFVKPASGWRNMKEVAILTSGDGDLYCSFGSSVAISGNTIVVGDPETYCGTPGSIYVFVEPAGGWKGSIFPTARLNASDGIADGLFGYSVAISGDTIIAGAPEPQIGAGSGGAYVFVKPASGWVSGFETAKLTSSNGQTSDAFGTSVAVDGSTVSVGAPRPYNPTGGAAYVYVEPANGWTNATQTAELTASSNGNANGLGTSVGISGNTVVAGAPTAIVNGNASQGAAYVFVKPPGGWINATQTAALTYAGGYAGTVFGSSIAIDGTRVVVGAPLYSGPTSKSYSTSGASFIFERPSTGWMDGSESAKLTGSDARIGALFGTSVSIRGHIAVAGTLFGCCVRTNGGAYMFLGF